MYSAIEVDRAIEELKKPVYGYTKAQLTAKIAHLCLGWAYIFGARGQYCTVSYRRNRSNAVGGKEGKVIAEKCMVLNGKKSACKGCKWFPKEQRTRTFDCRGFTWWVLHQIGIEISGGGATTQWDTKANWVEKGDIANLPKDKVCVLFWQEKKNPKKMGHTGLYVGGSDVIIHCSGTVKTDTLATKGWTNYAIPVGMYGDVPVPTPTKPTLRKGSTGKYVVECQNALLTLGYDLSPSGADGKYGKKTETAVKQFQKHEKLKVDGIVGKNTWNALDTEVAKVRG